MLLAACESTASTAFFFHWHQQVCLEPLRRQDHSQLGNVTLFLNARAAERACDMPFIHGMKWHALWYLGHWPSFGYRTPTFSMSFLLAQLQQPLTPTATHSITKKTQFLTRFSSKKTFNYLFKVIFAATHLMETLSNHSRLASWE